MRFYILMKYTSTLSSAWNKPFWCQLNVNCHETGIILNMQIFEHSKCISSEEYNAAITICNQTRVSDDYTSE